MSRPNMRIGSIVKLKSGSSDLTVDSLVDQGNGRVYAWYKWHDKNGNQQADGADTEALDVIKY